MTSRPLALLLALPALLAGLLVAAPADAASFYLSVKSSSVAISSAGSGKVFVKCYSSSTCRGSVWFEGDSAKKKSYSVPAKSGQYVAVALTTTGPLNPATHGVDKGDYSAVAATLWVQESSPKSYKHSYNVSLETPVTVQSITGTVTGKSPFATNVKVELWSLVRGGNMILNKQSDVIPNGGTFSFGVRLGTNNSPSASYRLKITGFDQGGTFRTWYWRGTDGAARGGARYVREASSVVATKTANYKADFNYGTISGNVHYAGGSGIDDANVTVAAPPTSYSTAAENRELDLTGCANVFGETKTSSTGNYTVNFLPYIPSISDQRYMVQAKPEFSSSDLTPVWNNQYGSCFDAMDYSRSRDNLISLHGDGLATQSFDMRQSQNSLMVNANYGFTPTGNGDRWIRIREKIPGYPVLSCPVIAEGMGNADGVRYFNNLPAGKYWVEIGRRTGASFWYASRYPNNSAYFTGADRGSEAWKTVNGKYAEYQKSYDMGYVARTPPAGRKGWMYRGHVKAVSAGLITTASFSTMASTLDRHDVVKTVSRGAVVRGHLRRSGGRTNKEMLIRLSSSDGTKVLRTDLTDGSGNFEITGLASGSYTISVNSDSWRGISRRFSGKHSIKVSAGHGYSAGTLYFVG